MKLLKKIALTAALSIATLTSVGAASAQDYMGWVDIDPYGSLMYDQWGNEHRVDPFAYDTQVDIYGNQISSYNGTLDPGLSTYDLTFTNPYASTPTVTDTYVPYSNPTDSHQSFINSIWE
jgi:hypothetical protein